VKQAYCDSHFVILPSKSEGWPKVVAEGMFWKCVPIASKVSCIPSMLDHGKRGVVVTMTIDNDVRQISALLENPEQYAKMGEESMLWSRKYTLDYFESQIKQLLQR
jgi:glycosyltransferase involved in cell wall biosynthesis